MKKKKSVLAYLIILLTGIMYISVQAQQKNAPHRANFSGQWQAKEAISIGGSVFWHHRDFLLPRLIPHMDGHLPSLTAGVQILPAGLQDKVGDYAALALVV